MLHLKIYTSIFVSLFEGGNIYCQKYKAFTAWIL